MKATTLVNVNGLYGCGAYEKPDFKELGELITHMDKFGIAASVTCHIEARDLNPLYGNRKLMSDIEATHGAKDRIIPCFVIAPAMLYRNGETEHLVNNLKAGAVHAVALYPKTSRCAVREYEKVLAHIRSYSPVVMVDAWEMKGDGDYRDLQDIAVAFPELTFIVRQAMWWQFSILADLMERSHNVRVDLSQFHFRDAISTVVTHFGKERIVFGLGPKAHGGAALAALQYADIKTDSLERITHTNIEELLKIKSGDIKPVAAGYINPLWKRFMEGDGLPPDIYAIDAHSHIGPPARGWYIPQIEISEQIGTIDNELSRFGINQIISAPEPALFAHPLEGNAQVENEVAGYGAPTGRFAGYFVYNPHFAEELTEDVLDGFFRRNYFVGLKIIPEYWRIALTDHVYDAMWEYADKHCLPILIHTWENTSGTAGMIDRIASGYPKAIFLLGHSGGGDEGRIEAEAMAVKYDNVYLEWCGSFTSRILWERTIKRVGAKKVIYGTDTFFHDIAWELGRLLCLDISNREFEMILGENMKRILSQRI
jgi:predicted TIM-barrel fold metal-dependent hydrolase